MLARIEPDEIRGTLAHLRLALSAEPTVSPTSAPRRNDLPRLPNRAVGQLWLTKIKTILGDTPEHTTRGL